MRVDTLDRHADLATVDECGEEQLRRDGTRVDVIEHNCRIISAQLQCEALERTGAAGHHLLAALYRAGE